MASKKTAHADKITITAEKRELFGKQTKKLRRQGKIPANVYGKDFSSLAITIDALDFQHTYSAAGETGVVYVNVEGESKEIPTLVRLVQKHPVNGGILHVDLRKINLRQKIETAVPFEFTGEAPAEKDGGVILYQMNEVMIEALPSKIPSQITVDISALTEVGSSIKIQDLPASDDYSIISDAESVIASATAHKEEEIEPDTSTAVPEEEGAEEGESASAEESAEPAEQPTAEEEKKE